MKVLLIGSGGREAAMAYALRRSEALDRLYVSPGSDGIAEIAECVPKMSGTECVAFCAAQAIDLVIFGGEAELVEGQADILRNAGITVLGASRAAAALEGSKDFLKSVLFDAGVPCAASRSFDDLDAARDYLATRTMPIVLKTDGLAGGKGVVIADTQIDAENWLERYLSGEAFGEAGKTVIIEDFLTGDEISFFVLVDAAGTAHPLAASRDHKRVFDGDQGANTGGMGAFTPVPEFTPELQAQVMAKIIEPSLAEMARRGTPYSGFLFAGLMLTPTGPQLLEYNVRLGDPETQVILRDLQVDFLTLAHAAATGAVPAELAARLDATAPRPTRINVVLAAAGYPEAPKKGAVISGLATLNQGKDYFHAGTRRDGDWRANGGRVLNVLGHGTDIHAARDDVYAKIAKIHFDGMHYRRDIGTTETTNGMNMTKTPIAEGKTKRVFSDDDPNFVILEAIDRLTAGDAAKIAEIGTIGSEKTTQAANIFSMLEKNGIKTAFVGQVSPIQLRCHAVDMLPIEFVMRRYPYGSYFKRNPGAKTEGAPQPNPTVITELFHKTTVLTPPLVDAPERISENEARDRYLGDEGWPDGVYTDPFIRNDGASWAIFDAKKPVEGDPLITIDAELGDAELSIIWNERLRPAFDLLEKKLAANEIALVDIKFEIGRRRDNGELVIADVIDNDSWRIWPNGDPKGQLDKQGFRDGDGLDDVLTNYKIVTQLTEAF